MNVVRKTQSSILCAFISACVLDSSAVAEGQSLTGRWEGEIQFPGRPSVFLADIEKGQGWLSTHGSTAFPLITTWPETGEIHIELRLGHEVIRFRARNEPAGLRGTAVVNDLAGLTLTEGSFHLRSLPELPEVRSRDDGWRQDLDVVLSRFLPFDKAFSAAAREGVRQRIERIKESVPRRTDPELMVDLARAIALSENAHTRLYLVRNRTAVRRLPIRVWWFREGFYVVRTTAEYKDLLGCRVERVDRTNIDVAAKQVRGIKPGNASWQRYMASYMLTSPEILVGSGILHDAGRVPLELRCSGEKAKRLIEPLLLQKTSSSVESWWDLVPSSKRAESTPLSALAAERVPLYLRGADAHYRFEYLPQTGILYFQYNRAQEMDAGPSLQEFGQQLLGAVDHAGLTALVVDLRFNTGGNGNLAMPLMKRLRELMKGKQVFVITGRATFSAGISHTAQWKEWGATIVGEPVGDELDWWAEGGNLELPNTKQTPSGARCGCVIRARLLARPETILPRRRRPRWRVRRAHRPVRDVRQ
jgi:hypothetical protein